MKIQAIMSIIPRTAHLLSQLFFIWATLDWKVRKARRAFESELVNQGIKAEDAKKLSKPIKVLKDQIMNSVWEIPSKWNHRHSPADQIDG
ncbi:MAG: hypothetical protein JSV05_04295 [Candidatus Bathyarchaeota archaeon]|nr:MAG: hypothetical protein JSV05_04295 [Candidatus Bathyarchaeota archaeon]